jgi:drug/metabolite transporter (DMT)-like permease
LIWLLPAAGCSILIALILKVNEVRGGGRVLLAGANYLVASLLSLALLGGRIPRPDAVTLGIGLILGINFVLGFLLLMAGIARGPLAVPVTVMRLSVAVPIGASIVIWGEHPGGVQWTGIVLGMVAIVLFGWGLSRPGDASHRGGSYWFFIVSLFLVMGVADVLLKTFRELSPGTERLLLTWILFTVSAVFTWILVWVRRIPFARGTFLLGLALGVPNLFSTVFMLGALRTVPASIAFPFVNLTVILGSALLGLAVWHERLRGMALAGLVMAAVALVLLPIT